MVTERLAVLPLPGINVHAFSDVHRGTLLFGATSETSPVGIPLLPVTAMSAVTAAPWVIDVGLMARVVAVALKVAALQFVTKLEMFTDPSPVARS